MARKAAITINRPREGVERLWQSSEYRPDYIDGANAAGALTGAPGGKLGEMVQKLVGKEPKAKVMDDLRRFKQHVETGVIARSEAAPEGELAERKLKQRPAQPLEESETEKAGV